jgi:membrane protein implicated in regulation of membrane protease activity
VVERLSQVLNYSGVQLSEDSASRFFICGKRFELFPATGKENSRGAKGWIYPEAPHFSSLKGSMITFLLISLICLVILSISMLFDHGGGHDALVADHDHDSSIVSVQSFLLFGVGFGAAGSLAKSYGFGLTMTVLIGCMFGVVIAIVGYWILRKLKASESDSTPSMEEVVGCIGTVIIRILPESFGEVIVTTHGRSQTYRAISREVILEGTRVRVLHVVGHDVVVESAPILSEVK